jgi:hypothetical protein
MNNRSVVASEFDERRIQAVAGTSAILPMHGKKEIGKGLEIAIKKQLGLK